MKLYLARDFQNEEVTLGRLFDPLTNFHVHTIELPYKDNKNDISCIPEGIYIAERDFYHKGGYEAFELRNVPDRTEIKIHIANYTSDILGCIGLGTKRDIDIPAVWSSRNAFYQFMNHTKGKDRIKIHIFNTEDID